MEICPICNGLKEPIVLCPACRTAAEHIGRVADYKGPYSPYMDQESVLDTLASLSGDPSCIHLFECPYCLRLEHRDFPLQAF